MKKVLAIALLCAVSSFATWDKFPVLGAGKGEAKAGVGYLINAGGEEKLSIIGAEVGARYSIIEGLEASLYVPFSLSMSYDGESCEADGDNLKCPPSYGQPSIGIRYWLPFGLGIALDVDLPLQGDAFPAGGPKDASKGTPLNFYPTIQYSTNLTSELSVGAEVGVALYGENSESKFKSGMDLGLGVEFDYAIGDITPYVGVDVGLGLGNAKFDGTELDDTKSKTTIDLGLGAIYKINDSMGADIGVTYGIGEGYKDYDDKTISPITILAHFSYYF